MTLNRVRPNLTNHGMLIDLTIKFPTLSKHNKQESKEVADKNHAREDMVQVFEKTIPKESITELTTLQSRIRSTVLKNSMPYNDRRLISSMEYPKLADEIRQLINQFDQAADKWCFQEYAGIVSKMRQEKGSLFQEAHYPSPERMRKKFGVKLVPSAIPQSGHFLVDMANDALDEARREIETDRDEAFRAAITDILVKLKKSIETIPAKLRRVEIDENGNQTGIFRDSIINNVKNMLELVPKLNIMQDPVVEAFAKEIETEICTFSPESLRISEAARERTIQATEDILKKMEAYI